MGLFKKKVKYEIYYIDVNVENANRDFQELQSRGWELAGNINPYVGTSRDRMLIPLKRKLK
ncbi:unnamed protein product [marine sediment metagenome]|uniref:Uncharacterized protein n=1 Tax=marine sediment metagenome TaxID=412755 RepID=X0ZKG1_9ZZZZ